MDFTHPTYVILPIKPPVADQVLRIRERYGHPSPNPVEVTVAGSSGVDVLEPDQDPAAVVQALERIAASTPPFQTEFGEVRRFPGTHIYWLSLKDEAPFRAAEELRHSLPAQPLPLPAPLHAAGAGALRGGGGGAPPPASSGHGGLRRDRPGGGGGAGEPAGGGPHPVDGQAHRRMSPQGHASQADPPRGSAWLHPCACG
ncbi:hypothetical protein STH1916 [Symbiobacterium thermophilum IAM 14863]|uniref:Uncharacterized protein n=1 Tax=Symbiobacterium thermophilum (strain DSM 24528 / JCM 14929 / IAM 14863 / T) TaxID=292459 RepID=Q67N42_SYMTH|nr:hypothetical protein STH1916 [Symbiobacterium thermophilum IAM 14863]